MTHMKVSEEEVPKAPSKNGRPGEVVHDESPALIVDHKFSPKGEWWSLCRHCHMGEAAHASKELLYYGDDIEELL